MAPSYRTPALPVATDYPHGVSQEGSSASRIGWRDYFSDPTLLALIDQSLSHNRDLRIATLRVQEAQALYGIQRSDAFPTVTGQAGMDRSLTPADLNLTLRPLRASQFHVSWGVSNWEIDFWGRIRSLKAGAMENYLATDATRRAVAILLIAQVAHGYLSLRELDERLAWARQSIVSRSETLRIFSRRVAVGATSRLHQTQAEVLLTQAQALCAQLEQSRALQFNALTLLVGAPIDLPGMPSSLQEGDILVNLRPGLPSELLVQRPDIMAAEHALKAANAHIGAARAAFFPRIALTGSSGTASAEFDGLFMVGSRAWTFSPSISLPLFDGGRRRDNLRLAEARRDLAVANYEKTIQGAFRDVADALASRRWLAEQVAIAQSAVKAQTERTRLSQLRYDSGASAFLEVLDAQRDLLSAEQQLVQVRRALLSSRVQLFAALGGGPMAPSVNQVIPPPVPS